MKVMKTNTKSFQFRNTLPELDKLNQNLEEVCKSLKISKEKRFPPALIANFILMEHGMKKREIQQILMNPDLCSTRRLTQELKDALEKDNVYSPTLNDKRAIEGRRGEERLEEYLDRNGIEYYAEEDLRDNDNYPKTPDILFKKEGVNIKGHKVNWIESKSNFGSPTEFRANYRKQLSSYQELPFLPARHIRLCHVRPSIRGMESNPSSAPSPSSCTGKAILRPARSRHF